ncbi:MAG: hypothetical protein II744_06215 [Eubacterium sp.]|nr:hypothetical protein [Eubacterium sp.]
MTVKTRRLISLLLCLCLLLGVFAGCSRSKKLIDFIYPFSADINSLDPQVASTSDEFLIIENTFEGLIRVDDDGTVKSGCAESWEVSKDGLTYTFRIKKGLKWNIDTDKYEDGEKKGEFKDKRLQLLGKEFNPDITANDFVFALRRAVMPQTNAPMFASVSAIKNAVKIHSGKAEADTLGVYATDPYSLKIELASPDDAFLETLSSAIAMPCNAEFFNATKGRYGLETKYTLFNGQFYLSQILEASYLLKQNKLYCGDYPATAGELTLKIDDKKDKTVSLLESGYYDAAFISGSESAELKSAEGINYVPYDDSVWAFLLNTSSPVFQSKTMRKSFCLGLSAFSETEKEYLKKAGTLTPLSCKIGNESAAKKTGVTVPGQNTEKSKALWLSGLKVINESEITVTVITPKEMQNETLALLQGVQSGICTIVKDGNGDSVTFTIKVEPLEKEELESRVASRDYDIAFYPFKSNSTSPEAFLESFVKSTKTGFDTEELENAIKLAEKSDNGNDEARYLRQAEKAVIETYSIFPVIYETSYYASAKGVSGIQFHAGSGRVSFVNATREE